MELSFNYLEIKLPSHEVVKTPDFKALYLNNEMRIVGEFGKLSHHLGGKEINYDAKFVTFKFPSEHSIEGKYFDAEILINHETTEGA